MGGAENQAALALTTEPDMGISGHRPWAGSDRAGYLMKVTWRFLPAPDPGSRTGESRPKAHVPGSDAAPWAAEQATWPRPQLSHSLSPLIRAPHIHTSTAGTLSWGQPRLWTQLPGQKDLSGDVYGSRKSNQREGWSLSAQGERRDQPRTGVCVGVTVLTAASFTPRRG